jgi:Cu-Zn family superoxide dismutase
MNRALPLLLGVLASGAALGQLKVEMNAIDIKGVGAPLGFVTITAGKGGGVVLTPDLKGLPPGPHGFHVHEFANCGARAREGKMEAGALAGSHWDPKKTGKHGRPDGDGHMGDLPPLQVDGSGRATKAVTAPRLKLDDLKNKSLVIHAGGDNFSDQPKPSGGGGERIACGVIETRKKG